MKRFWIRLAAVILALAPAWAAAQSWPTKPVKIVVPFAAGGATDVVARLLAQKLTDDWGQSVVVENRTGAGGNIGAEMVAKSPADGYTLMLTSGAVLTSPYMYKGQLSFDPLKDLVPITNCATGPQVIAVSADSSFKDLRDLIAFAKANPRKVNFGSAGIGSQTHLAGENFAHSAGVDLTHVPYKGESAALTDLLGGQIQLVTPNLGGVVSHIQSGKVRALAVTSTSRVPQLPDVPPASEMLPGFENAGWFGLMAPAGTPREVIERAHRDSVRILTSDEFKAALAKQGMVPVANSPAEFGTAMREESARWARVIKERGLAAN
ncbi:MAG TPA: tripartite tricarboxylate transporter substrate binding protein [Usitatibacter sp.]|nr:tripartite tricarboxylate transporter substrate binding protein [Usitatibacter sp.]